MGGVDPQTSFSALLPEQFGKYSLLGHLATGGMAEVWLARKVGLEGFEKIVVIKRARRDRGDEATARCVLDEARLVAGLEHPNIAQVYETDIVDGAYFFVMEYVDGADLRRLIETALARRHKITLGDALYIVAHVCDALHYAHEKRDLEGRPLQIIHRDVSPSNVLISHDGAIKVCDFGIARTYDRPSEDSQNGVLRGKLSYMSPEQCRRAAIDRRSDVFSIGILLYELTTLSKLFRAGGDFQLLQKIVEEPIAPPSTKIIDYPVELEAIVMKALARDPDERYQTAQELQLELEAFAREHKVAMSSIGVAKMMASLFERRNDAWIRAQRAHSDHFVEASSDQHLATGTPGALDSAAPRTPSFMAAAGAPAGVAPVPRGDQPPALPQPALASTRLAQLVERTPRPVVARAPRRWPAALCVTGALVAAVIAAGVTIAAQVAASAAERDAASALLADAARISSVFDAASRAAHLRADGIAATPMLRAALETDVGLRDLASSGMIGAARPGEALDVFQIRDGETAPVLHVPPRASSLPVLRGRDTLIQLAGTDVSLVASAPIAGYQANLVGGLVISTPVELAAIRRALAEHAVRASLHGIAGQPDGELVLTDEPAPRGAPPAADASADGDGDGDGDADGTSPVTIAVASGGEWCAHGVTLEATPRRFAGLGWARPVRNMSGGLAVVLLLGFAVGFARRGRDRS